MSFDQIAIVALLLAMLIAFALGRFRIEVTALAGLAAGFALGVVPVQRVFAGFSSAAVITVVEILLIVSVLSKAQAIEQFTRSLTRRVNSERGLLLVLCGMGAAVSVFMNNVGALALMFPIALSVCARLGIAPNRVLMPLSFATLLGGICSLTGTPANLVVNEFLVGSTGRGLGYFEIGLVGFPVAIVGVAWIVLTAPRLLPREADSTPEEGIGGPGSCVVELTVPGDSDLVGKSLLSLESRTGILVHGVVRAGKHLFARRSEILLQRGDVMLAEGELDAIDEIVSARSATFARASLAGAAAGSSRLTVVVMPDSVVLGSRLGALAGFSDLGVAVLGIAGRRLRVEGTFDDLQIGLGDVLVLSGDAAACREVAADAGLLSLSVRAPKSHAGAPALSSVLLFAAGVLATAVQLAPPEIAFGGVVIAMALMGKLQLRSALPDINWSIVILLACMVPLGMAVEETGAARVVANSIVAGLPVGQPFVVAVVVLLLAAAITPFVDNVSTVAVLSPVATEIASRSGLPVEPLLIAVAVGASLDFLTPCGHHNNAVVMGAAGYRFQDFSRLGAPLLLVCLAVAMIALWPLTL